MNIDINKFNCAGIYIIKNNINGKIYVGKSKNCYKRLYQHIYDLTNENRNFNENPHLLNAYKLYGDENFSCHLIEKLDVSLENIEELLSIRELFWMNELKSLNKDFGYNLRYDSNGKCFVSEETSEKISNRLKNEWKMGIRKNHSQKLKENWKNNTERKLQQSKLMSKIKQKYYYTIKDINENIVIEKGDFSDLKKLNLHTSVLSYFSRHKSNVCKSKGYIIERLLKI